MLMSNDCSWLGPDLDGRLSLHETEEWAREREDPPKTSWEEESTTPYDETSIVVVVVVGNGEDHVMLMYSIELVQVWQIRLELRGGCAITVLLYKSNRYYEKNRVVRKLEHALHF